MDRVRIVLIMTAIVVGLVGCRKKPEPQENPPEVEQPTQTLPDRIHWSTELVKVVEGLDTPECALFDPNSGQVFVSNIATADEGYWDEDGKGFVSAMSPDGVIRKLRCVDSTTEAPVHAPKGMGILDGYLYFADITSLKRCRLDGSGPVETIALPEAQRLNDIACDIETVWVSDVAASKLYRVDREGKVSEIPAPENINGVTCWHGKIFAVSWFHHDVYELDPEGNNQPIPFGLAKHFTNLDGIEVLDDGTFVVSDFTGNKVCTIEPDRKTVKTLVELETPADIGLDRAAGMLYVPQLTLNKLAIFKLTKE